MQKGLQEAMAKVKHIYQTDIDRINAEKEVIYRYGALFRPQNIDNLTAEEFKSFLWFRNNKHWKNIHRYGNRITSDMKKLKSTLKLLLDESKPIKDRLDEIMPKNKPIVKGLNKAVLTPILLVVYPEKYCVYNGIVERGMKHFGIFPNFKGESFGEKYTKINEIINSLAKQYGLSLWQIDEVWYYAIKGR